MKIEPLHDRVLVKIDEAEEETDSGLIIPESAKEKPTLGTVIAVGKGRINEDGIRLPMDVEPGNRVMFGKYAGTEMKLEGVEHMVMREDEMLCIVRE